MEGDHRLKFHENLKLNYDIHWRIERVELGGIGWNWLRFVSNRRF